MVSKRPPKQGPNDPVPPAGGGFWGASASADRITPPSFGFQPVVNRAEAELLALPSWPRLVTVTAAPGYGKTVLLSRLHAALGRRDMQCLWVSLDDRDADATSLAFLIQAALAALKTTRRRPSRRASDVFAYRSAALDDVLSALSGIARPTVLFVDNLGYCVDSALPALLDRLVFAVNPHVSLVLSSTLDIPVDAVRAKAELGAVEVGAPQLRFEQAQVASLLQHAGLDKLGDTLPARIHSQTEGWPMAVRLLQVLLTRAAVEPGAEEGLIQQFSGDHRDMARWLTRRVLSGFEPALVRFMLEIALVREFSVELAQYMTERTETRRWLDTLVARNVLIFPTDRGRRWLRFHNLLREFLLAEGRDALAPDERRVLQERAMHWHDAQGELITALSIALEVPAVAAAELLIARVASTVVGDQGRMDVFITWADRLQALGEPCLLRLRVGMSGR